MTSYSATKKISRLALIAGFGLPLFFSAPVNAGFQWITPLDSAPVAKPLDLPEAQSVAPKKELPPVVQLPVEQSPEPVVAPEVVAPTATSSPVPAVVEPTPVVEPEPVFVVPTPVEPATPKATETIVTPVAESGVEAHAHVTGEGKVLSALEPGENVEGFGKAIPLVVALKQTLPQGYIYAFEEGIKPATPVDWKGGRGWRVVLTEALAGAGLVGYEQGNRISILKADPVASTEPTPAVMEAPVPVSGDVVPAEPEMTTPAVEVVPSNDANLSSPPAMIEVPAAVEPVTVQPAVEPPGTLTPMEVVPQPATQEQVVPEKQGSASPEIQQSVLEPGGDAAAPMLAAPALPLAAEEETKQDNVSVEPIAAPVPTASEMPVKGQVVMPNASLEPPLLPGASDVWRAEPGEHLRDVIRRWASRAGVELVWSTEYDFPIQAGVSLNGSFEEAVRDLLSGFVDAKPQPFGRLHDNPNAGQRTLVVQTRGNTGAE